MAESTMARRSDWWPARRMSEWFDWLDWPGFGSLREGERMLRIEERKENDALVIRAEMPGIDPEKDVEITLSEGMLTIKAERHEERKEEEEGGRRFHSEFSYGSFTRTVPLPSGATEDDVKAEYKDGILTVHVPIAAEEKAEVKRVAVSKS